VVDDFEPVRKIVCSKLEGDPRLQVICQVSDGLEAVRKAEEFQPELILLDLSLPTLSGMEAARRIRTLSPSSKILFVTQESSMGLVEEALRIGARGYILKSDISRELLPGIGEVLRGGIFISSHLAQSNHTISALVSEATRSAPHWVAFYRDEASLVDGISRSAHHALDTGRAVIAVVTESHRAGLLQILKERGGEIDTHIRQQRLIIMTVAEANAAFGMDPGPDATRFCAAAENLLEVLAAQAIAEKPKVVALGEWAFTLLTENRGESAIKLEEIMNYVSRIYGEQVAIHCAYLSNNFESKESRSNFGSICTQHSAVLGV
jgi:CheY-like chemotaxis protein